MVGRAVAVIQVSDASSILRQSYYYGFTQQQPGGGLATYARAIAVVIGANQADTRIAICGDTFDAQLPRSPDFNQAVLTPSGQPAGFVAVFDGDLNLLWSRHFFGADPNAATGITDLVLEHDPTTDQDIITYCGASTNGAFVGATQSTMPPTAPFSITGNPTCAPLLAFASGDTHNAASLTTSTGNWDGIVGQIRNTHSNPVSAPQLHFHSIVGGFNREALFGIAKMGPNRYATVGFLDNSTSGPGLAFPITIGSYGANPPICEPALAPSRLGIIIAFDSSAVPGGPLTIIASTIIGSDGMQTMARDIAMLGGVLWVVGSSNDPNLATAVGHGFQTTFSGTTQGFIVGSQDITKGFDRASFMAGGADSAAIGVAGFPESPDHIAVVGWRNVDQNQHIELHSLFADTASGPIAPLRHIRGLTINKSGTSRDIPGALSSPYASLLSASPAMTNQADLPQGGAVAVDERGLITTVGSTTDPTGPSGLNGYPVTPPSLAVPRQGLAAQVGHGTSPSEPDAVLSIADMLPTGVCRTDGTGSCFIPWARSAGTGGTTPACALIASGGTFARILLDVEGTPQPGQPFSILVDRPPSAVNALALGGVIQIGFPSTAPTFPLGPGIEIWSGSTVPAILTYIPNSASLREPLWTSGLPPGPQQFTVQFVSLMQSPVCPGLDWIASPGLLVGYSN